MSEIIKRSLEASQRLTELKEKFFECNDDRTPAQLEFGKLYHPTPERQYLWVMKELRTCYFEIRRMLIERQECIDKRADGDTYDMARKDLRVEQLDYDLDAKLKEFEKLMTLKGQYKDFTKEEIEGAEDEYFKKLLNRKAMEDRVAAATHTSVGVVSNLGLSGGVDLKAFFKEENNRLNGHASQ